MAELNVKWTSFLVHQQFINLMKSDCNLSGLCQKRLDTNGKVLLLADCLHLVDWGGNGTSGNKLPSGHRELGSAFSVNLINSPPRQQIQTLTNPKLPPSPSSSGPLGGGWMRMRGVKYFLDYTFSGKVSWSMCCSEGEQCTNQCATASWIICSPAGWDRPCAAPVTWHQSRCCSCCWELPPLWQVSTHPASLSSHAGSPGCFSLTCTANGHKSLHTGIMVRHRLYY